MFTDSYAEYDKYVCRVMYWRTAWETSLVFDKLTVQEHYASLLRLSAQQAAKYAKQTWPDLEG